MRVIYPHEMQSLDEAAVRSGIDALDLMERAGRELALAARNMLGVPEGRKVCIVAGKGKNGGDGMVAARYLADWGAQVSVLLLNERTELHPDALANHYKLPNDLLLAWPAEDSEPAALKRADLIIDCIFGIGFRGVAEGVYAVAIQAINESGALVLAADIPSGVDGADGSVSGPAVRADRTVTFALAKTGLYLYPGADLVGELEVREIGIPPLLLMDVAASDIATIDEDQVGALLPARAPDAHKGSNGRVLVLAGSVGMTGAAALTSLAALRMGAGMATLGIPASLNAILETKLTEVMTIPLPETAEQTFAAQAAEPAVRAAERMDAVALGPGIGTSAETQQFVATVLREVAKPLVLDADGLNCAAAEPRILADRSGPLILTPHPTELSRLTGRSTEEIIADRVGAVKEAAQRFGCPVVLKGAHTLVADPAGRVRINLTGVSGMATAGSGDVLTGCIAALLAQGLAPFEAALCGVYLHGAAGELASVTVGEIGMLAGDIAAALPVARSHTGAPRPAWR